MNYMHFQYFVAKALMKHGTLDTDYMNLLVELADGNVYEAEWHRYHLGAFLKMLYDNQINLQTLSALPLLADSTHSPELRKMTAYFLNQLFIYFNRMSQLGRFLSLSH